MVSVYQSILKWMNKEEEEGRKKKLKMKLYISSPAVVMVKTWRGAAATEEII